jgi:hypothetical protein
MTRLELGHLVHMATCYGPLKTDLLAVTHWAAWLSLSASLVLVSLAHIKKSFIFFKFHLFIDFQQ